MISKFFQVGFGLGLGATCGVLLVLLVIGIISTILKKLQ